MTTSCKVKSTCLSPGGQGTAVTISGTGFDLSNNEVTVGGADCAVTLHSSTSLECTMSVGPNGPQSVSVHVPSKGLASGSLTFTFTSTVSSISPTSGSLEGWSVLMSLFFLQLSANFLDDTCFISGQSKWAHNMSATVLLELAYLLSHACLMSMLGSPVFWHFAPSPPSASVLWSWN